jgi:hypothetical protein
MSYALCKKSRDDLLLKAAALVRQVRLEGRDFTLAEWDRYRALIFGAECNWKRALSRKGWK